MVPVEEGQLTPEYVEARRDRWFNDDFRGFTNYAIWCTIGLVVLGQVV
jgi:hypothetical protein